MKKTILATILTLSLLNSCSNSKMIITNQGIGKLILGQPISQNYDRDNFDVTLDSKKNIKTIIINSEKHVTKDGFGVGSSLQDLEKKYPNSNLNKKNNASKGKHSIIDLGQSIIIDSIIFVDKNKDNLVDYIILHKTD
ncbi:hypothetical protein [Olleya namhaensis]|uniref:hypothetical protein n=1 Tax=Olleya namhaensis TaxID=1144750 RepID=UPI00248FB2B4|nr:hypothetical protein [Olleya namhaensis]